MNGCSKLLTAACLSAAILLASAAQAMAFQQARKAEPPAVTLRVFESARHDDAKQARLLDDAYDTAIAKTVTGLRSTTFSDGKTKTPQRIERDMAVAKRVDYIARHMTDQQSKAMINMIAEYGEAQPDTKLEDVIIGFLLTEAREPQASPK